MWSWEPTLAARVKPTTYALKQWGPWLVVCTIVAAGSCHRHMTVEASDGEVWPEVSRLVAEGASYRRKGLIWPHKHLPGLWLSVCFFHGCAQYSLIPGMHMAMKADDEHQSDGVQVRSWQG